MKRCTWAQKEIFWDYHDNEWGKPVHDDKLLFEALVLDGAQAGLSWETILKKRPEYRRTYKGFDPKIVSQFTQKDIDRLLGNAGIVRNKLKIKSSIQNAKAFLDIQKEFGSFDNYLWGFVNHKTIVNSWKNVQELPAKTDLSDKISKDLKKRGFSFVGSTIIYAMMQAIGMVNDHEVGCSFRK